MFFQKAEDALVPTQRTVFRNGGRVCSKNAMKTFYPARDICNFCSLKSIHLCILGIKFLLF